MRLVRWRGLLRVLSSFLMVEGSGVGGLRLSVEHIWLRVWDLAFKVQGSGCGVEGGFGLG